MSEDSMTESQRNQLAAELTGPGAFERHAAAAIEQLSGLVVELVRERSRATVPKPPKIEVRNVKAELSAEPVGYADEFDTAEDMAKLRRERDEARNESAAGMRIIETMGVEFEAMKARRYEAAKKATEYLRERDEAQAGRNEVIEKAEALREKLAGSRAAVRDLNALIGRVCSALGFEGTACDPVDAVATLRRELLELRQCRDELRSQLEAAEKKAQAFPGAEIEELREKYAQLQRNRDLLDEDLSVLCRLIVGDEHSSYVLASREVERLKEENGKMKARLSALGDWQTSISAALGCSPANAFDRVEAWKAVMSNIQTESNEAPTQGEES